MRANPDSGGSQDTGRIRAPQGTLFSQGSPPPRSWARAQPVSTFSSLMRTDIQTEVLTLYGTSVHFAFSLGRDWEILCGGGVEVLEACPRVHSRQELPERLVGLLWAVFILWRVHFVGKGLCLAVSAAGDTSGVASPGGGAGKGSPAYPPAQRLAGPGGPCR